MGVALQEYISFVGLGQRIPLASFFFGPLRSASESFVRDGAPAQPVARNERRGAWPALKLRRKAAADPRTRG